MKTTFRIFSVHLSLLILLALTATAAFSQSKQAARLFFCIYEAPKPIESHLFYKVYTGVAISSDKGGTWTSGGWSTNGTNDIAEDPNDPSILYLANDFALLKSVNNGKDWKQVTDWSIPTVLCIQVVKDGIWIGTAGGPYFSLNGVASWSRRANGLPALNGTYISDLLVIGDTILAATADGIFRSGDNGISWTAAGLQGYPIDHIGNHPALPDRLLAYNSTHGVWISENFAASWKYISENLPTKKVQAAVFDPSNPDRMLVGTQEMGVLLTSDRGRTWENVSGGLTNFNITALLFDRDNTEVIYAGCENGSFVSRDRGSTWEPFSVRLGYISAIKMF